MGLGLWFIREVFRECRFSLRQRDYLELRGDYEEYHEKRQVGRMVLDRAERIRNWIEPGSLVLDLGCGDGTVASLIKSSIPDTELICRDLSSRAVELARRRGLTAAQFDIESGDLDSLPGSDYVLVLDVLEHTANPHLILPKIIAKARKGVIVSFPNSGKINFRIQLLAGIFPRQSWTHLHFWTASDFPHFCGQLGLEIIDFMTEKPPPGLVPRFLYRHFSNLFCEHLYFLLKGGAA